MTRFILTKTWHRAHWDEQRVLNGQSTFWRGSEIMHWLEVEGIDYTITAEPVQTVQDATEWVCVLTITRDSDAMMMVMKFPDALPHVLK